MARAEVNPSQFTYSVVLNACSRLGYRDLGQLTHAHLVLFGIPADLPLQNALLHMYCSCGDMKTSFVVFSKIESTELVSWNLMIAGHSENGDGEKALDMFVKLWRMLFTRPDEHTFAAVISAIGEFPTREYGKPVQAQVEKAGFSKSVCIGSILICMYFNNGETDSVEKIFYSISEKNVVLWTDMIAGHCKLGNEENAIRHFFGMPQEGLKIDSFTLSSAFSACADLATKYYLHIFICEEGL